MVLQLPTGSYSGLSHIITYTISLVSFGPITEPNKRSSKTQPFKTTFHASLDKQEPLYLLYYRTK